MCLMGLFKVKTGAFTRAHEMALINALRDICIDEYQDIIKNRNSTHIWVRDLKPNVKSMIDEIRCSDAIISQIRKEVGDEEIEIMPYVDELYVSNYHFKGGDQGLYDKHKDGNMTDLKHGKFLRALVFLSSAGTYETVFESSGVSKKFKTYDFGILDFNDELHYVKGRYNPNDPPRIMLKLQYFICPKCSTLYSMFLRTVNNFVFQTVKTCMNYSKNPSNIPQWVIGELCNVIRELNNIHNILPVIFVLLMIYTIIYVTQYAIQYAIQYKAS